MKVPFLDLAGQYARLQTELDTAISEVLSTASFIGGPRVGGFEREFAAYIGADHCVGVGNGTDALELALRALELPPGGEVIVPANSFIGSSEAVTNAGLTVRFCDVDSSYTLDPAAVKAELSERTVAIMPVHLYGQPADMDALVTLAEGAGLKIVEDCAQAHGAEHRGRKVGTFGDAAAFSFYPGKNLGAYGDAGAVVTDNEDVATRVRMLANHGRIAKYDHEFEGRNSRLDGLQAAVLSVKLRHLDDWTVERRRVARTYLEGLRGVGDLTLPPLVSGTSSSYHLFVVRTGAREALRRHLAEHGVATGVHYPTALPDLPAYGGIQVAPNASAWAGSLLSLPIGDHVSDAMAEWVVRSVRDYFDAA